MRTILEFKEKEINVEIIQPTNYNDINFAGEQLKNCLSEINVGYSSYNIDFFYFLQVNNKLKLCIYINPDNFRTLKTNNFHFASTEIKGIANSYVKLKYIKYVEHLCKYLNLDYNILKEYIWTKEKQQRQKEIDDNFYASISGDFSQD